MSWISDKSNASKRVAYTSARSAAQRSLRQMKEQWWLNKAVELQQAADRRDIKAFSGGLRAVYGKRDSGSIPVRSLNGTTLITDRAGILNRWAEHFQHVLNQESKFDQSVLDEIPQWDTADALMDPIEPAEVQQAFYGGLRAVYGLSSDVCRHVAGRGWTATITFQDG